VEGVRVPLLSQKSANCRPHNGQVEGSKGESYYVL
jgi:hypothetical protein